MTCGSCFLVRRTASKHDIERKLLNRPRVGVVFVAPQIADNDKFYRVGCG